MGIKTELDNKFYNLEILYKLPGAIKDKMPGGGAPSINH
jgi:hypothetical protein